MQDSSDTAAALSFIAGGKWAPARIGDYEADCARGRGYAKELLDLIERTENPALFGSVMRAITVGGRFEAVETGFCSRIGIILAGVG